MLYYSPIDRRATAATHALYSLCPTFWYDSDDSGFVFMNLPIAVSCERARELPEPQRRQQQQLPREVDPLASTPVDTQWPVLAGEPAALIQAHSQQRWVCARGLDKSGQACAGESVKDGCGRSDNSSRIPFRTPGNSSATERGIQNGMSLHSTA